MGEQVSLAGRRFELARLSAVVRGSEPLVRTCVIVGEAGIGKTRLLEAGLAEAAGGPGVVAGACLPLAEGLPFMPVAELIRRLIALRGNELLARLTAEHPRYVLDQVAGLVPELADAVPPANCRHPGRVSGCPPTRSSRGTFRRRRPGSTSPREN